MGASQSVSAAGDFAHAKGWRHRLHRVESNPEETHCGVCSRSVEVTAVVYSCGRCSFVVHESCHNFPKKIKQHFAHPAGNGNGRHTLKLVKSQPAVPGGHMMMMCSICDTGFDAGSFVYECIGCRRFYAHPLCCRLPETKKIHGHEHPLTLRAPPNNNTARRRRCLNAAGKCRNAARLDNDRAWTYQCDDCRRVELCLACQLPAGATAQHPHGNGHGADAAQAVAHDVATAIGTFFRTMCCACLGVQVQPPQPMPKPVS